MQNRSLSFKLLLSYLAVVILASSAAFGVARWLGPRLFDEEVQQIGLRLGWVDGAPPSTGSGAGGGNGSGLGRGSGAGGGVDSPQHAENIAEFEEGQAALDEELVDAFSGSLSIAMLVALGVGGLAALVVATLVSRRLVRPLQRMSGAVRLMADGHHDERVPVPKDLELAGLAADVNALGRALEDTEERRAQLVSDLAHELRTPITSIDGFLEGLEDGVFEADAETLGAMRGEARRLQRLATDLGVLSLAAEQAFDLAPTDLDLAQVAQEAGRGLAAAFSRAGVLFEHGDLVPLPVLADRDRVGQIFTNLIRNGLQHTPAGGSVRLTGSVVDGMTQVVVSDTGDGITPADLARVFDRFFRSGEDASPGAGVGLTIARAIARAHGGDVTAASPGPNAGSTFTVTIPLRD